MSHKDEVGSQLQDLRLQLTLRCGFLPGVCRTRASSELRRVPSYGCAVPSLTSLLVRI